MYAAQARFDHLTVLLPQLPGCCDYKLVQIALATTIIF